VTNPSKEALGVCTECGGTGTLLIELYHRQGFDRDSGYIQERVEVCDACDGSGEVPDGDSKEE
jgi:hypothetical protein